MFRGTKGKLSALFALATFPTVYFLVVVPIWQMISLPDPYYVPLPEFQGRVLPAGEVKPGTFTVSEDFNSISGWGDEAILIYGSSSSNFPRDRQDKVKMEAWKPDSKVPGVFSYATSETRVPASWGFFQEIGSLEREDSQLKVFPARSVSTAVLIMVVGVLLTIVGIMLAWVLNPKFNPPEEEK